MHLNCIRLIIKTVWAFLVLTTLGVTRFSPWLGSLGLPTHKYEHIPTTSDWQLLVSRFYKGEKIMVQRTGSCAVEAAPRSILFGPKTFSASKSLLPTMFHHSSFPISLSMLHSSPFNPEYTRVDMSSLPDSSPLLFWRARFSWLTPRAIPHVQRWLCCPVCTKPQGSSLPAAHSFSLHPGGPSAGTVLWGLAKPQTSPQAAPFVGDLQLPWCFRQVSQCLHHSSVACWSCSARLLFESAQNF